MRPFTLTYSNIQGASAAGYATNVTGATFTLTATTAGDGLAHQTSITNNSITDHSAKTVTIVGTDADGLPQTETGNLPGVSATVNYTKFFKTITSVTPSATIGADTMNIGWLAPSKGPTIVVPNDNVVWPVSASVIVSGTINFDIENTTDNPYLLDADKNSGNITYIAQSIFWQNGPQAAKTSSFLGDLNTGLISAFRLDVNSVTTGASVTVEVLSGKNT